MMQNLREQTQSTGFKVLVVAIIIVLTFFGFGATNATDSPSRRDPDMASKAESNARLAAVLEISAASAMWSTNSLLFTFCPS